MNIERKLSIVIKELPIRARKLDGEELRKMYGGLTICFAAGWPCTQHSDCCNQNCSRPYAQIVIFNECGP